MNQKKSDLLEPVSVEEFGQLPGGESVKIYTLSNKHGMKLKILNYGAIISEVWVPKQNGELVNVVLGFDNLPQYLAKHPRFGSSIGRYANRIATASFDLDGEHYKLAANNGSNCIHGGLKGFDKCLWETLGTSINANAACLQLHYFSKDMEEGFPGNLDLNIEFSLTDANELKIKYTACSDKATPVNFTNHSYFNLKGAGNGNILDHLAEFRSDKYTVLDENSVPTGEIASVENTPFDFRKACSIASQIEKLAGGFDINYVVSAKSCIVDALDAQPEKLDLLATVTEAGSGLKMECFSDQPGFQFFTANGLNGSISGNGGSYMQYAGFCIETQHFADSVHHPQFPNTILRPGQEFRSTTVYKFSSN
ncbi:MAG: galactose mutarotase [Candidatus Obscuribacterales bacterium]|nr:galactose mutarotase [Candidatus Obscuribacterales bacterium]